MYLGPCAFAMGAVSTTLLSITLLAKSQCFGPLVGALLVKISQSDEVLCLSLIVSATFIQPYD